MKIITGPDKLQRLCLKWRLQDRRIALVPTMGFYHKGHKSLMRAARKDGDKVVVSLFVNPTQFGPNEDLAAYPRNAERDMAIAEKNGADVLFMPDAAAMFPDAHGTWIEVPSLAGTLCGVTRPTHFRGVCTVVMKLFMLSRATVAFFGEKDWQQAAIIKRMVADLNVPVEVRTCPIVREKDGLAMSSRNVYLSQAERREAPHLYRGLCLAAKAVKAGERQASVLLALIRDYWQTTMPSAREEYLTLVDPETLAPVEVLSERALCALAVRLGSARLIDNMLLKA